MAEDRKPTADEQRRYLWKGRAADTVEDYVLLWEVDGGPIQPEWRYRLRGRDVLDILRQVYQKAFLDGAEFEHQRNRVSDDGGPYRG